MNNGQLSNSNGAAGSLASTTAGAGPAPQRALFQTGRPVLARPGADRYDALLWRLCACREDADNVGFLLGLTGCSRRSGVSTLAANLAIRAADQGLGPVLLVDANLRHPTLHRVMRSGGRAGLVELMAGQTTLAECIQPTPILGLDFLPLGAVGRQTNVRIDPQQIDPIVAQFRERYSLVICDLPEARELGHTLLLACALDAAVLVLRAERVARRSAQQTVLRLAEDGVHVLGAVVTDQHRYLPGWLETLL